MLEAAQAVQCELAMLTLAYQSKTPAAAVGSRQDQVRSLQQRPGSRLGRGGHKCDRGWSQSRQYITKTCAAVSGLQAESLSSRSVSWPGVGCQGEGSACATAVHCHAYLG